MKKSLLFALAVFAFQPLFAQNISIGAELGMISSINTAYRVTEIENRRNTYYNGLNLNYNFNNKLSMTTGLHYLRQGYQHETCYLFGEGVRNRLVGKLDYLMVPLAANLHLGKSQRLIATLGLYGAFNIKAIQDVPDPIGGCKIGYVENLSHITASFMMGGIAGLGYKIFASDRLEMTVMARYLQGLSNVNKNHPHYSFKRSSAASITLAVNYRLFVCGRPISPPANK